LVLGFCGLSCQLRLIGRAKSRAAIKTPAQQGAERRVYV
jgi:hypothetical protein